MGDIFRGEKSSQGCAPNHIAESSQQFVQLLIGNPR
jgi:hypothetical protein